MDRFARRAHVAALSCLCVLAGPALSADDQPSEFWKSLREGSRSVVDELKERARPRGEWPSGSDDAEPRAGSDGSDNGKGAGAPPAGMAERWSPPAVSAPIFSRIAIEPRGATEISGRGTPGSRVMLSADGVVVGSALVGSSGRWLARLEAPLAPGVHRIESAARDGTRDQVVVGSDVRIAIPASRTGEVVVGYNGEARGTFRDSAEVAERKAGKTPAELEGATDNKRRGSDRDPSSERLAQQSEPNTNPILNWLERSAKEYHGTVIKELSEDKARAAEGQKPDTADSARPETEPSKTGPTATEKSAPPGDQSDDWLTAARRRYQDDVARRLQAPPADGPATAEKDQPDDRAKPAPDDSSKAAADAAAAREEERRRDAARKQQEADAEARRLAEDARQDEDARKKREEDARRVEQERQAEAKQQAEAARRDADAKRQAEEAQKQSELKRREQAEKQARDAADRNAAAARKQDQTREEEAKRKEEQEKRFAEANRKLEEKRLADEAKRKEAEERKAAARKATEDAAAKDVERKRVAEAARQQEAEKKAADRARREEEAAKRKEQEAVERKTTDTAADRAETAKKPADDAAREPAERADASRDDDAHEAAAFTHRPRVCRGPRLVRVKGGRMYMVQPGDSLWSIALKFYGNGASYDLIFKANQELISDPEMIVDCQRLFIPKRRRLADGEQANAHVRSPVAKRGDQKAL